MVMMNSTAAKSQLSTLRLTLTSQINFSGIPTKKWAQRPLQVDILSERPILIYWRILEMVSKNIDLPGVQVDNARDHMLQRRATALAVMP